MIESKRFVKLLASFSSIILILLIWAAYSFFIKAELILPTPLQVFFELKKIIPSASFWLSFFHTLLRVFIAFSISVIFGCIVGFLSSISEFLKYFFDFPISILRTTPVIAVILLALFWFNSTSVPVFVSVLMTSPIVITAVCSGLSEENINLMPMAQIYNFTKFQIYRYIKFPACKTAFLSALESCFGLSWKVVVAGEVLSIPRYACGSLLQRAQVHLETSKVIAITIILIVVSYLFQIVLKKICYAWSKN